MQDIKQLLGKNIRLYRQKKNLSQEQLAELIGINFRSLSLIERGANFVTAETLTNIALALETPPKKFFEFDDEFMTDVDFKKKLIDLINKNEDKVYRIYKIVKGFLE